MLIIKELIRIEADNTISFGNYLLEDKKKVIDFEFNESIYKVKTFNEITKLEKNNSLLYESVPGTAVHNFSLDEKSVKFGVVADKDANITLELEKNSDYKIYIDNIQVDKVKSNLSGKVTFSLSFQNELKNIRIEKY